MNRKGILRAWDDATYKATVELVGSERIMLEKVPASRGIPTAEMVVGRKVILVLLNPSNPQDAVVVGVYT